MKTETHTPGPWIAGTHEQTQVILAGPPERREYIAVAQNLGGVRERREESQANARLIAAAPDLLGAAKLAADSLQDSLNMRNIVDAASVERLRLNKLRAAIAKAEGRQAGS